MNIVAQVRNCSIFGGGYAWCICQGSPEKWPAPTMDPVGDTCMYIHMYVYDLLQGRLMLLGRRATPKISRESRKARDLRETEERDCKGWQT